MLGPLFAAITSFLFAFSILPFVIRFSKKKAIGVAPGSRRIHKTITPSLGGVAIFFGFVLSTICWATPYALSTFLLLTILVIPFIIGLLDDLIQLTPVAKLIAQVVTATLIFLILDIRINSFYGLIGDHQLPEVISYLITVFTVIIITNSLNLIDGIDGLAAVIGCIAVLFFGTWFYMVGVYSYSIICLALAGGIIAFLFMNWEPSKIFMGDTGSLVIGTLLAIITIKFINENSQPATPATFIIKPSVGMAVAVLMVPLMDTSRIIVIRLIKGVSLFTADKRHIHHVLLQLNLTHQQIVCILALIQVGTIALAIGMRQANPWLLIGTLVAIGILLCVVLDWTAKRFVRL